MPNIAITGVFDEQTRLAVIEFQKIMSLPPTGIVDSKTWDSIYSSALGIITKLEPTGIYLPYFGYVGIDYKLGDESPAVFILQTMLQYISLTIPSIPFIEITGIFNETTQNAVKEFQKQMKLNETGFVNETTWNVIVETYNTQRYGPVGSMQKYQVKF